MRLDPGDRASIRAFWKSENEACEVCEQRVNKSDFGDGRAPLGWSATAMKGDAPGAQRLVCFGCQARSVGMTFEEAFFIGTRGRGPKRSRAGSGRKNARTRHVLIALVFGGTIGYLAHAAEGAAIGGAVGLLVAVAVLARRHE